MSTTIARAVATPQPAFAPAMPVVRRQCACGARSKDAQQCAGCAKQRRRVQRLAIGASNDPFEREAHRIADQVLSAPAQVASGAAPLAIQRDTGAVGGEAGVQAPASVQHVLDSGGRPLDPRVRHDMEGRFGHDFSAVRVHDGPAAAASARDIDANAYTAGNNIVFGAGRYAPASRRGMHLLAHELTHVVQQSGASASAGTPAVQRDAAPATLRRDSAGGGSTTFADSIKGPLATDPAGVVSGKVTRTETAPATDTQPAQQVSDGTMNVRFDPSDCSVTIPFGYRFVQAAASARADICDKPAPSTPVPALSATRFAEIKAGVIDGVNRGLNGWFDVQLSGKGCPAGCTDRRLPVRVVAREDNATPDTTITVVNRGGRANAGTICAESWSSSTNDHEGGHQVLGLGDEYPEDDQSYRATAPEWFRPERVRRDYSKMGPEAHSRFALFHERHFNAVKTFLDAAFTGCRAELHAKARPVVPDFRIVGGGGYSLVNGQDGAFAEGGLRMGIPLDRLRRWEFVLGPQFRYLVTDGDEGSQKAFLLGARLGLDYSAGEASHGPVAGIFGEGGAGKFSAKDPPFDAPERGGWAPYVEGGAGLGYRTPMFDGGGRLEFRIEGAAGKAMGKAGENGPRNPFDNDPQRSMWFRLGANVGIDF